MLTQHCPQPTINVLFVSLFTITLNAFLSTFEISNSGISTLRTGFGGIRDIPPNHKNSQNMIFFAYIFAMSTLMQNFEQLQCAKNIQYFQGMNLLLGAFLVKRHRSRWYCSEGNFTCWTHNDYYAAEFLCVVYKRTNLPIIRVSKKKVFEEMSEGRNS